MAGPSTPRFRKSGPLLWVLVGAVIAVIVGLWLTLAVQPASVRTAPVVATPPVQAPAPMPQPQPAT